MEREIKYVAPLGRGRCDPGDLGLGRVADGPGDLGFPGGGADWWRAELRAGLRSGYASAGLPPTRTAAASLSHGAPRPASTPGFPDARARHPRAASTKGPQQPALVHQLHVTPLCSHEVLDSLH